MGYSTFKNGRYVGDGEPPRKIVGSKRGPFGFIPQLAEGIQDWAFYLNGGFSYIAADGTETKTGTGASIGMAAGGLQLVSGNADTNNSTWQGLRSITPAAGKRFAMAFRLSLANIAKGKAFAGLFNTQAAPGATAPTDGIWFSKDTAGTGVIHANMAGNNTAATPVVGPTLVNSVDVEFGLLYVPTDSKNGIASFWWRAADVEGWGEPNGSIVSATDVGPQAALRASFNITATDANSLTETIPWWGVAMEL